MENFKQRSKKGKRGVLEEFNNKDVQNDLKNTFVFINHDY